MGVTIRLFDTKYYFTGGLKDPVVLHAYCAAVVDGIKSFAQVHAKDNNGSLETIHLVNFNPVITDVLKNVLQAEDNMEKRRPLPPTPKPSPKDAMDNFRVQRDKFKYVYEWKIQDKKEQLRVDDFFLKAGNLPILTEEGDEQCVVCMDEADDPVILKDCSHKFCRDCIMEYLQRKPACPVCNQVYGEVYGDQPVNGKAVVYQDSTSLPGYEQTKTWIISYEFPDGNQTVRFHVFSSFFSII